MPTANLPNDPSLAQLRNQARELQRAVRAGDPDALAVVAEFKPGGIGPTQAFPLSTAQLVLARQYRFASWARLQRHVKIVTARSWSPGAPPPADEPLPDRFLRLACLTYTDSETADRTAALRLLAEHPELPAISLPVAAVCADVAQVSCHLAADRSLATTTSGPHGWSPLLYQAYARHDPDIGLAATLQTARLLLDAGADPNDGRFWHGLPSPFTVLTGVFGYGEQAQPFHPHSIPFARLLLEAGADPNDAQTLYNRMFILNDDHLVLLFEFGLGRSGDGGRGGPGPWHRLLGDQLDSPTEMLRSLLGWAIAHDQRDRVALLAANGVDVVELMIGLDDRQDVRTPVEYALVNGHRQLADQLLALGAHPPRLGPVDTFVAAAMAGDADTMRAADPAVISQVRQARPGLMTWAASQGAPNAVELLVTVAGYDVNSYGRSDGPADDPWHTALHVAAMDGNLRLAERLLELGADPGLRDKLYSSTPLGWARHFGQQPLINLLERIAD